MSTRQRWGSVFVVAVLCVSVVAGSMGVVAATSSNTTTTTATTNETTNATSPHTNPEEIDESGDDHQVANYLAARLGGRLNASAVAISEGEYEQGRVPLGGEYETLLDQYAVVAEDIDAEETAAQFELTREQQLALAASIAETEATAEAYQQAVENGNDEQARELARDLLETAEEVNTTATDLQQQYTALEGNASIELDGAQLAIEEVQQSVGQATAAIVEREFTETTLTARTDRPTLTTGDPATVSGRLTAANGTPIENASVTVGIEGDTVSTQTDANGTFETAYHPLVAPATATNLTVAYVPGRTEPFLPATATVPITIPNQTATTLRLTNTTETAGFDESVQATGTVRLTEEIDRSLAGIPLVLTVDDQRLATATTDAEGRVTLTGSLPANTPVGDTTLQIAIDREGLAIERATASAPISVLSTPTALSLTATSNETTENRTVNVTGRLTTTDGTALTGRPVRITAGGTDLGTIETNATGRYEANYTLPATVGGDSVSVTATFDGAGTNLAESTASHQVSLTGTGLALSRVEAIAIGGGIVVTSITALVAWRREWGRSWGLFGQRPTADDRAIAGETSTGDTSDAGALGDDPADDPGEPAIQSLLATAQAALGAGQPDEAVRAAYMAVRARLGAAETSAETQTHWEFYRQWQDDDKIETAQLQTVTEAYEAAAFAPDMVSAEQAAAVVTATTDLVEPDPTVED